MTSAAAPSPTLPLLGRTTRLTIRRFAGPGAFLAVDASDARPDAPVVLLPGAEVPEGAREGDVLEVFLYLDSEDRPVATLRTPRLTLDAIAFLPVVDIAPMGAFFDWGLAKHLLVPHAEQTRPLRRGDTHPIALYVDPSGRLAGTMRVSERLRKAPRAELAVGDWVEGEAWRYDHELGLFAIAERRWVGRVPADEPHGLRRGEAARFRVVAIFPDGKVELSLRAAGAEQRDADAERVLEVLARPNPPRVGDKTDPDALRAHFGLSKKAFKRAVGGLLKRGLVTLDDEGFVRLAQRS